MILDNVLTSPTSEDVSHDSSSVFLYFLEDALFFLLDLLNVALLVVLASDTSQLGSVSSPDEVIIFISDSATLAQYCSMIVVGWGTKVCSG